MTDKKERNRTETGHNYAYYNGGAGVHVYNNIIYILIQTYVDSDMSLVHRGDIKKTYSILCSALSDKVFHY